VGLQQVIGGVPENTSDVGFPEMKPMNHVNEVASLVLRAVRCAAEIFAGRPASRLDATAKAD
jgi:hypothetical protein